MDNRVHWADRPLWVRVGLFGVPSRRAALLWMQGTLVLAILFLIVVLAVPITINGVPVSLTSRIPGAMLLTLLLLVAPFWYWLAIRWTDEHDGWALHTWKS
jgi:hypothetical protein